MKGLHSGPLQFVSLCYMYILSETGGKKSLGLLHQDKISFLWGARMWAVCGQCRGISFTTYRERGLVSKVWKDNTVSLDAFHISSTVLSASFKSSSYRSHTEELPDSSDANEASSSGQGSHQAPEESSFSREGSAQSLTQDNREPRCSEGKCLLFQFSVKRDTDFKARSWLMYMALPAKTYAPQKPRESQAGQTKQETMQLAVWHTWNCLLKCCLLESARCISGDTEVRFG